MLFHSLHAPHIALRVGLAAVFMWFGVDKFISPDAWLFWVPDSVQSLVQAIGMTPRDFIFLNGIFEVLVAVSLLSGYFIRIFASLAALFVIVVVAVHITGPTETIVRDVGLAGALIALALWPERTEW